jgi:pimeloyl-ACP methyl ester carboxylesterase
VRAIDVAGPACAPAIVLVHGSVVSRKMWLPQLQSLADSYRVIAPDLPGHGDLAAQPFTLDAAVAAIETAIDGEAGGRAAVVALSLGGYVAVEHAHRRPEQVAALVLAGCSRDFSGPVAAYLRLVAAAMRRGWLKQSPETTERKAMRVFPAELHAVAEEQRRAGVHSEPLPAAFEVMAGRAWSELLASYPGPTLILNGERDSMARKHEARFAAAARRGTVATIAGAGHAVSLDRPVEVDRAVREHLRRAGPRWSRVPEKAPAVAS